MLPGDDNLDRPMGKREPAAGSWVASFARAFRGTKLGVRGESSFFVHFFMGAAVVAAALALQATMVEWCLLLLCIALVLTAEMLNSGLERLAKAIDENHNPQLRELRSTSARARCWSRRWARRSWVRSSS